MIIFAHPRHVYDSYTDYRELVRLSGFATCYIDEIDLHNRGNLYIIAPMNGELKAHLNWEHGKECTIMLWNLERPGNGSLQEYIDGNWVWMNEGYIDSVIVSDLSLSKDTGFHYIPLGSHEELGQPGTDKHYDFVHLMAYSPRRGPFFQYPNPLREYCGYSIAPNGWGEERDHSLKSARFMLNVHQDNYKYMEPLRFALAAAYGLPLFTEKLTSWYPYPNGYEFHLLDFCREARRVLDSLDAANYHAAAIRKVMTGDFSFRNCVERYL